MSEISWFRQINKLPAADVTNGLDHKSFDQTFERVISKPLYQNNVYAVIDTVQDLVYTVIDLRDMRKVTEHNFDFSSACHAADSYALVSPG